MVNPANLTTLEAEGIDAYIVVRAVGSWDNRPESAAIRVTSTHTGTLIAGFSWQNGWGGQGGSIADRTMRKNMAAAARQIGNKLAEQLSGSK